MTPANPASATPAPTANLGRIRWGVRAVLALGVATSVVANVLHALPNPISQAIAAWPPLALLLTVELISRVPVHRRSLAVLRVVATASIAGIAAWVSYWHMAGVAARYGEVGAAPYLIPLSVDGLIVVASICLVELSGQPGAVRPDSGVDTAAVDTIAVRPTATVQRTSRPDSQVDTAVDIPAAPVDRTPVRVKPVRLDTAARLSNADRVIHAHQQWPDKTNEQLAEDLGVSTKTVQRYRPKPATGQINGHAPALTH